jgi:hypothetical protein
LSEFNLGVTGATMEAVIEAFARSSIAIPRVSELRQRYCLALEPLKERLREVYV